MNVWLAFRAGKLRYNVKILHGDGGHPLLMQRMRAQANFIENTPFVLFLAAAIEMTGKGGTWLAVVGSVYLLARICHAFGMDKATANPLRAAGFLVTALTLIGLSAVAVDRKRT